MSCSLQVCLDYWGDGGGGKGGLRFCVRPRRDGGHDWYDCKEFMLTSRSVSLHLHFGSQGTFSLLNVLFQRNVHDTGQAAQEGQNT